MPRKRKPGCAAFRPLLKTQAAMAMARLLRGSLISFVTPCISQAKANGKS
jgi:hypothetical protein